MEDTWFSKHQTTIYEFLEDSAEEPEAGSFERERGESVVVEAQEKIKAEMQKEQNPYVQVIGQFLLQHLDSNPASAEQLMAEDKTILKSLDAMRKAAEKQKVGNCAVLTDQEGFAVVLQYFGITAEVAPITPVKAEIAIAEPDVSPSKDDKADDVEFNVALEDFL